MFSNYIYSWNNQLLSSTNLEQVSISGWVDTSTPGKVDSCLHERYLVVTKGTDVILRDAPGRVDFLLKLRLKGDIDSHFKVLRGLMRTCSTDFCWSIRTKIRKVCTLRTTQIVFPTNCISFSIDFFSSSLFLETYHIYLIQDTIESKRLINTTTCLDFAPQATGKLEESFSWK